MNDEKQRSQRRQSQHHIIIHTVAERCILLTIQNEDVTGGREEESMCSNKR